ncbi:MAG: hypothetical protein ACFCUJ_13070 [Thiotrichales bacterium]
MKRVAVIAVHGVADQAPFASARAITDLLIGPDTAHDYFGFQEESIRLGLRRVEVARRVDTEGADRGVLNQGSATFAYLKRGETVALEDGTTEPEGRNRPRASVRPNSDCDDIEHDAMREQLQNFAEPATEPALETVVARGFRRPGPGEPADAGVDVFEMYWADLSRLKSSLFSVLFEFYLLLFFLSRLGGIAIDRAQVYFKPQRTGWRWLSRLHEVADVMLTLVVPILLLCLLSLGVVGALYFIPSGVNLELLFALVPGAVVAGIGGIMLYRHRLYVAGRHWPWLFPVILAATLAAILLTLGVGIGYRGFVFWLWLIAAGLVLRLCRVYETRRAGAWLLGRLLVLVTALVFALTLWTRAASSTQAEVYAATLASAHWLANLNTLVWAVIITATVLVSIAGAWLSRATPLAGRPLARQTVWTVNLSLILPSALVLILNTGLWQALAFFAARAKQFNQDEVASLQGLIDQSILPGLSVSIGLIVLALLLAVWSISPAALGELFEGRGNPRASRWLGDSLSAGFRWMRLSGEAFRVVVIVLVPLGYLISIGFEWPWQALDRFAVLATGLLILIAVTGSHGPFRFLALGFRGGLDIALDVANWLRNTPTTATPRAAICRRYASLLRHIAAWRDPRDNHGYSGVVIVAHSQGTVITADLLRFLTREYGNPSDTNDPSLHRLFDIGHTEHLPVYLFTMGSPLRQLYNLRFPLQYGWSGVDGTLGGLPGPDPSRLTLIQWSNAYRSGDYVGRYLWRRDDDPALWSSDWKIFDSVRRECCIGPGAHTRYWDGTAPEVAHELDRLIGEATRLGR